MVSVKSKIKNEKISGRDFGNIFSGTCEMEVKLWLCVPKSANWWEKGLYEGPIKGTIICEFAKFNVCENDALKIREEMESLKPFLIDKTSEEQFNICKKLYEKFQSTFGFVSCKMIGNYES